jgi:hypothetical protein
MLRVTNERRRIRFLMLDNAEAPSASDQPLARLVETKVDPKLPAESEMHRSDIEST